MLPYTVTNTNMDTSVNDFNQTVNQHNNTTRANDEVLKKLSNDFESLITQQMLKASFDSVDIAGKSAGSSIVKGMYTQALADHTGGALGISDILFRFLKENQS